MPSKPASSLGFSPEDDRPIPYMERTRRFYHAIGFETAYRWASFAEVPFRPLAKPLAEACVGLLTTAAPFDPAKGDQGPGASYNSAAKFYTPYSGDTAAEHDLRISHVTYDRTHTTAADQGSYFPLRQLRLAAATGRIGRLAQRFHGAPTNRSHRTTMTVDAPEIVRRCQQDGVDAVVLVPNCPVCHQTLSLVARLLEQAGVATVIMGCAKDIVEQCGVPRFLFSDFPLGNAAGKPNDPAAQSATLEMALRLLETAFAPRTTVQSHLRWAEDASWKQDFLNVDRIHPEELAREKAAYLEQKKIARGISVGD